MLKRSVDQPHFRPVGMYEEACEFGPHGRSFGVLTLPVNVQSPSRRPVVVLLNAGLIHRVGPSRLYVLLARELAALGFAVLRVDLYGRGDSALPANGSSSDLAAANFADIKSFISSRFGDVPMILGGLCSGADDAIRFAITDKAVQGLILLDAICFEDAGFRMRGVLQRVRELFNHPVFFGRRLVANWTRWFAAVRHEPEETIDPLLIRNAPNIAEVQASLTAIATRRGHVLSIFTRYATRYYNHEGQMAAVALPDSNNACLTEIYWPDVHHTYSLGPHRRRLLTTVTAWCDVRFPA